MLCDYYFDIPQTQHFCMMILTHFLGMAQRIVYTTHLTHTPTPHTHPHLTHTLTHTPTQKEEIPSHYGDYTPDHKLIYKFIKTLFHAAQLTAECGIITLVRTHICVHLC